jgi:hypothetical protein
MSISQMSVGQMTVSQKERHYNFFSPSFCFLSYKSGAMTISILALVRIAIITTLVKIKLPEVRSAE